MRGAAWRSSPSRRPAEGNELGGRWRPTGEVGKLPIPAAGGWRPAPRLVCQGAYARPPTPPAPGAAPLDPKPEASTVPSLICSLVSSTGLSFGRVRQPSPAGCALHVPACRRHSATGKLSRTWCEEVGGTTGARTPPRPQICCQPRRMALPDNESGTPPDGSTVRPSGLGVVRRGQPPPPAGSARGGARSHPHPPCRWYCLEATPHYSRVGANDEGREALAPLPGSARGGARL